MKTFEIALLADHPQAIPALKLLFESEWEPYYGNNGPGNAEADILASAGKIELPIAIVALKDDSVIGTAALKQTSVSLYPNYTPWLAALVVAPEFRGLGVGERLIGAIECLAKKRCHDEIYVGAGEKSRLSENTLRKRNWKLINEADYFISKFKVYKKEL